MKTRAINTTTANIINKTPVVAALMQSASKYDVLTPEEELDIMFRAKNGDVSARQALVNHNLRFMISLSAKFAKGDEIAELVSLCTIGIYNAIDSFEYNKGFRFLSYAVHYMREQISEYFEMNSTVRNKAYRITTKANALSDKFYAENGKFPTESELVEMLEKEYSIAIKDKGVVVPMSYASLDKSVGDEEGETFAEVGEVAVATANVNDYEKEIEVEDNKDKVAKLLATLDIKTRAVIEMSFGVGAYEGQEFSDEVIGEKLDLGAERVRQIRVKALKGLGERVKRVLSA